MLRAASVCPTDLRVCKSQLTSIYSTTLTAVGTTDAGSIPQLPRDVLLPTVGAGCYRQPSGAGLREGQKLRDAHGGRRLKAPRQDTMYYLEPADHARKRIAHVPGAVVTLNICIATEYVHNWTGRRDVGRAKTVTSFMRTEASTSHSRPSDC